MFGNFNLSLSNIDWDLFDKELTVIRGKSNAPTPASTSAIETTFQQTAKRDEDSRRAASRVATLQDTVTKGREGEDSRRAASPVAISQGSVFTGREGEDSRRAAAASAPAAPCCRYRP